jgi:hypothetical protein
MEVLLKMLNSPFNEVEVNALILLKNGYEMEWLKPIDQFPNTNHLEIVSKFNIVNKQKNFER